MEKGKVFPYVPIYSLPINPHSALGLSASVHTSCFFTWDKSPHVQLPLLIPWLLPAKAQSWQPVLCLASLLQEWNKRGALEATNPRCPGCARLFLPTGQTLLSPVLSTAPAAAASALSLLHSQGWCLHMCLDPCREMENACPQPGSVVRIQCGITHQASHEFSVCSGSNHQHTQWGQDWREREEEILFVCLSTDWSKEHLTCPV